MKNRIIIIVCIILTSCCMGEDDTYRYVSDDMYPIYKEGDTLFYKSNWNNLDTFIYMGLQKYYDCQSNEDYCNTETCVESLFVVYHNIRWPNDSISISAFHEVGDHGQVHFEDAVGGFFSVEVDSVIIAGYTYYNVFHPIINEIWDSEVQSIIYGYKYGILQFDEKNGQTWTLQRND